MSESSKPQLSAHHPHGFVLAWIGVASGLIGGLSEGGGGIVTVPILDKITSWPRVVIHGTSTMVNIFVTLAALTFYLGQDGRVEPWIGLSMIAGSLIGAPAGARFAKTIRKTYLRVIFILALTAILMVLLFHGMANVHEMIPPWRPIPHLPPAPLFLGASMTVGLVVGFWSAAMGLGGGTLTVPALVLLFGYGQHMAEGTSFMILLPNAIVGAISHRVQGTIAGKLGLWIGGGALCGATLGVSLALCIDARVLTDLFCLVMTMAIVRKMTDFLRDRPPPIKSLPVLDDLGHRDGPLRIPKKPWVK